MARGLYQIKLKDCFFPALSEDDALDMQNNGACNGGLNRDEVEIVIAVSEEHTMRLFLLAKTMYDSDKFKANEVEAAVRAVAIEMGYTLYYDQIASSIVQWVERICEDMTAVEMEEWLIN